MRPRLELSGPDGPEDSFVERCCDSFWIKPDQDLVADNDRWSRTTIVRADQFKDRGLIAADIPDGELDSSLREERPGSGARRSTGLAVNDHFLVATHAAP